MQNEFDSLLEFKKGWEEVERISCALTCSSSHLLLYFSTELSSNLHHHRSMEEP